MLKEMKFEIDGKEIVLKGDSAWKLYMELKKYFEPRNTEYVPYPVYPQCPGQVYPNIPWYTDWWKVTDKPYTITYAGTLDEQIVLDATQTLSDGTVHIYQAYKGN